MVANIPHHHEEVIAVSMGVPGLEEFEYIRKSERRIQTNIEKEFILKILRTETGQRARWRRRERSQRGLDGTKSEPTHRC